MSARKALHRVWIGAVLVLLASCFGCAITVQKEACDTVVSELIDVLK